MFSPPPYLKNPCFSLMVSLFQNLDHMQLVFSHPRVSKQEMEPACSPTSAQSSLTRGQFRLHSKPLPLGAGACYKQPQRTEDLGFLSKHHDHPIDLLPRISLTSSIPTILIAALITYSHGCSVELGSWSYFTSDISEEKNPTP